MYTILGEDDTQCDEVPMEYVISFLDRNFEHVTPYKYLLGEELSEENYFQTMRQLKMVGMKRLDMKQTELWLRILYLL